MKITCITVGKKHDPKLVNAIEDYEKRLKSYCDFSWAYIPTSDKDTESAAITKQLKDDDVVVLLDERGKLWANNYLSQAVEYLQNSSTKRVVMIIGGAYGVNDDLVRRSNYVVAFSPLVFPHQIVRLLVVEQLYRTYAILSGSNYHHN